MEWIIITAVFIFSLYWMGAPFFSGKKEAYTPVESARAYNNLALKKEELLTTLADLSMDVKTGKMDEKDFDEVYGDTMVEAGRVYKEMDASK